MNSPIKLQLRTFDAQVLYFNGMYKLPVASYPSLGWEQAWQNARLAADFDKFEALRVRMKDFFGTILPNEVKEYEDIEADVLKPVPDEIEALTNLADLLGDIQVYCASEMARLGLPNNEILQIIMRSNFSKLDANGCPIYDENGKVGKGPNYYKPEPEIKALILQLRKEHGVS
jgi:predicted HAD superfamily Cof-like phosphohydrolase